MNDLTIRQMKSTDVRVAMQLKDAEGWNQTEADWHFLMRHNPDLCLVACEDSKVVGTVTAVNYHDQVSWVGMLLVHASARGRGIGKQLLQAVIEKSESCHSIKLDATPAGKPVYRALGFVEEYDLRRMITIRATIATADADLKRVLPLLETDMEEAIELDGLVFGTSRPDLIRYLLRSNPDHCWCMRTEGSVSGIALMRRGTRFNHIGPVQARSAEDAKLLVSKMLAQTEGEPAVLDLLSDKVGLENWLEEIGFRCQRSLTRMYLGTNSAPGIASRNFAIAGPELG